MGQTKNFSIPYPEGTDPYAPLHTWFANQAQSVDTAIMTGTAGSARAAGSAGARDAIFPNPVQGNLVFRTDRGYIEQYHAAYSSSTNPLGATPAGWYPFLGRMPEIYLPVTGTQVIVPDVAPSAHSRPLLPETFGTPRVTPGASEFFTIDASRAITFTRPCEVNISWALTQVGGVTGTGRVLGMVNDSSWSVPSNASRTVAESEQPFSTWRQWHTTDTPHSAFNAGDVLRFGIYGSGLSGEMTFGTKALARACYFRITVTGPRE